jgi:hypothetical protein
MSTTAQPTTPVLSEEEQRKLALAQQMQQQAGVPGFGDLVAGNPAPQGVPSVYTPTTEAAAPMGGNYYQNQAGSQGGTFNTIGQTNTAQQQQSGQVSEDTKVGTTETQQTGRTGVEDTLGFGALLQGSAADAQSSDADRNRFLKDMVNTGGQAYQGQTDQAIRNSLTGPQMTGAGDSARARAAGYAASQTQRQNTDQRLNAAQQLAGPSAISSLAQAGNPYLAQTQSGGSTTNINESAKGLQAGFQNLLGSSNEATTGTAAGQSSQAASGQLPQTTQSGGGGCVICTVALELGTWRWPRVLRRVVRHKLVTAHRTFRYAARGYFFLGSPIARLLLRFPVLAPFLIPVARAVVYEELRVSGRGAPFRVLPWLTHWTWHWGCYAVGRLPIRDDLSDRVIVSLAQKHNVFFKLPPS